MAQVTFWLQTGIIVYLVLIEPFYGVHKYKQLERMADTDPLARVRFYRHVLVLEWGLVGLVALTLWLGQTPADAIGLRLPVTDRMDAVIAIAAGASIGLVAPVLLARRSTKLRATLQAQWSGLESLLPAGPVEERWYVAVAVTAGVCEELLFRGFLIAYVRAVAPATPGLAVAALVAVVFGVAHLYQGWKGVLATGGVGAALAMLYLDTGSLLWPILIHVLLDLRVLPLLRVLRAPRPIP